ncbi:MAG: tetratricopeptide repeat protein [Verrucomicrobia bacterium]|nr:tetratricopeptide repeat protein [Verrucomicrobiota bacterium]
MFNDEPSESRLAVWFRSLTMGTRIQIVLFSVLGIFLGIGATIALIKEPAILLPEELPDSQRVAGEPERPKVVDEGKVWRQGGGIMAQSVEGNFTAENQGELQAMRKLVKISPNDPDAWDRLGKSLYGVGLYDEAVTAFRESLKIKPKVAEVLANLGVALKTKGREQEYKKLLEELAQVDAKIAKELENFIPQNQAKLTPVPKPTLPSMGGSPAPVPASAEKKGSALQNQGEIDALRKLIAMDDKDADAWDQLGKSLYLAGQYDEAVDCFRKSLAIRPDEVGVLANLGVTLKTKGDKALYEEVAQKLALLDAKMGEDLKKFEPPTATKR